MMIWRLLFVLILCVPAYAQDVVVSRPGGGGGAAGGVGLTPVVNVSALVASTGLAGTGVAGQAVGTLTATNTPTSWAITSQPCANAFAISNAGVITGGSGASCMAPGYPGQSYSVTVTASNAAGTSAGQAISVTVYPDGALDAPVGTTIQHPTYLDSYSAANRPPWKVAGVTYAVGIPSAVVLKNPTVDSLPAGCAYDSGNGWVRCDSGSGITFDGWDFTVGGGKRLYLVDCVNTVVTNSKFGGVDARAHDYIIQGAGTSKGLTVSYSLVDGGFTATGQAGSQSALINMGGDVTSPINLWYNDFSNYGQHVIETGAISGGDTVAINYKYNLIDEAMISPGSHQNCLQLYQGGITPTVVYNFMYQSQLDGAECFQFYGGVAPDITLNTAYLSNNVMIALKNGGVNTMSNMNTAPDSRTTFVGPAVSNDNFFNTIGGSAYYPGGFVYGGGGTWTGARNKLLTDGSAVTFPPPP